MQSTREIDMNLVKLIHPFTMIAAGPTGSGKTYLIRDLLMYHKYAIKNISKNIINVVWAYGIWQNIYNHPLENVNFKYINGVPEEEDIENADIIIIDDLMRQIRKNGFVLDLFTQISHHNNQSVIILSQNLYTKGEIIRDLNLNSHYVIIFKSPRDQRQVMALGNQIKPREINYFMSSYEQATESSHGYLLIDNRQETREDFRLRTRIIPTEESNYKFRPIIFEKK